MFYRDENGMLRESGQNTPPPPPTKATMPPPAQMAPPPPPPASVAPSVAPAGQYLQTSPVATSGQGIDEFAVGPKGQDQQGPPPPPTALGGGGGSNMDVAEANRRAQMYDSQIGQTQTSPVAINSAPASAGGGSGSSGMAYGRRNTQFTPASQQPAQQQPTQPAAGSGWGSMKPLARYGQKQPGQQSVPAQPSAASDGQPQAKTANQPGRYPA